MIDDWPLQRLVRANCAVALVAALTNGLFLIATTDTDLSLTGERRLASGILVGALVGLLAGVKAVSRVLSNENAARVQGTLLLMLGGIILLQGIDVILHGAPEEGHVVWNAPMFVVLVGYAVYFARRAFLSPAQMLAPVFRYAHIAASIAALVVSAFVVGRLR